MNGVNDECQVNGVAPVNGHCNGVANGDSNGSAQIEGFDGVQNTDAKEYLNNYKAHKTGISHEEMVQVYTQWAANYDKVMWTAEKMRLD